MSKLQPQKAHEPLQHCKAVASNMPSTQHKEDFIAGDEWIWFQEIEFTEDDLKCRVYHILYKVLSKADAVGDLFVVLPKMVNCALALSQSNAGMYRSLSKTKGSWQNRTCPWPRRQIIGIRATKDAMQEYGGMKNVPITLDIVKIAENSYLMYNKHLRQENLRKDRKKQNEWNMKPTEGIRMKWKLKWKPYI